MASFLLARVVDQDIQPTEFSDCFGEHRLDLLFVRNVPLDNQGPAAEFFDLVGRFASSLFAAVKVNDNIRPGLGQTDGDALTDT